MTTPDLVLTPMEQRILGSLMEKQRTVPSTYPMTLNALRLACNQTSSRDPVVAYDEEAVERSARDLRHRELIRVVHGDRGQRVVKYHQRLDEQLALAADERAVMTVLLLRGAQSAGELRTRTERLHGFVDRADVEVVLRRLAGRADPLVRELPRRVGQHDTRWIHLLGPVEAAPPEPVVAPVVDRESVLAGGPAARDARVRAAYDTVAAAYADRYAGAIVGFDSWLLHRVAELAGPDPVVDVGCGPGNVTATLAAAGADVVGLDMSPAMVAQARDRHPGLVVEVGDLRTLVRPRAAAAWGAVTAWHALVHLAPSELAGACSAFARVLRPGGWLAVALPVGAAVDRVEDWLGTGAAIDVVLHDPEQVRAAVAAGGFAIREWYLRGPAEPDETAPRLYVLASAV
jgi:uncharacterized protein YceH (UPF0502 family)